MFDLTNKRAVVTGASRGIGQATAVALAQAGADVASIHLPDPGNTSHTIEGIEKSGRRALMVEGDVADGHQVQKFAERVKDAWGGIDVWVNNAARFLVRPFLDMTDEEWTSVLNTNLNGYYHGCRAALTIMIKQEKGGRIINVSSVVATQPIANLVAYVTAKGGVVGMTKSLALEFAPHGIAINAVAPGAVETALNAHVYTPEVRRAYNARIAVGRIAKPGDIVGAIVFLASDAARYICGQELIVDGGLALNGNVGFAVGPPAQNRDS